MKKKPPDYSGKRTHVNVLQKLLLLEEFNFKNKPNFTISYTA